MDCKEEAVKLYKEYIDTQVKYADNTKFIDNESRHFINLYTLLFSNMVSEENFNIKDFITAVFLKGWFKCRYDYAPILGVQEEEEI